MIRKLILTLMALPVFIFAPAIPAFAAMSPSPVVFADSVDDACAGIGLTGGNCKSDKGSNRISGVIKAIVTILSAIVGIAAVIMIIVAGLRYITSGGEASKVSGAKSAIIYAIVGLIVVALAQVIVHFVLGNVS